MGSRRGFLLKGTEKPRLLECEALAKRYFG
jgi:hypothetical protein